jgi:hypothetical protein
MDRPVTQAPPDLRIGELRPRLDGVPAPLPAPPVIGSSGDPFTTVRVLELLARIPRGRPILIPDVVARLNATHLDWLFDDRVVADVALQLQSNWIADYRSTQGIVVEDGPAGATVTIEDSTRVDPWIVRQVQREVAACREELLEFSRRDRSTGE